MFSNVFVVVARARQHDDAHVFCREQTIYIYIYTYIYIYIYISRSLPMVRVLKKDVPNSKKIFKQFQKQPSQNAPIFFTDLENPYCL